MDPYLIRTIAGTLSLVFFFMVVTIEGPIKTTLNIIGFFFFMMVAMS